MLYTLYTLLKKKRKIIDSRVISNPNTIKQRSVFQYVSLYDQYGLQMLQIPYLK